MESVREIIFQSEPLLLFLVIGIGFLLGQIKIRGFKLGVAGVLFVGLIFGSWHPVNTEPFSIAHQVMQVGLILFVYTVGLTSGSGFFASLKKKGVKFNIALVCSLAGGGLATLVIGIWMQLQPGQIAGVFCGGLTNTPALAAVTELLSNSGIGDVRNSAVGYSMAYPFGIIGGLLAFQLFYWLYRKDAEKEKTEALLKAKLKSSVSTSDFKITNPNIFGKAIGELRVQEKTGLIISRCEHNEIVTIPTKYTILQQGDIVSTVGPEIKINEAEKFFGTKSSIHIDEKKCEITIRRILVSNKKLAGKSIQEIELDRLFNAQTSLLILYQHFLVRQSFQSI